ncbi:MAG: succinylglutamate desuccinylase/aspartoacylase family protein [Flavobacteriales bacterium]|nr:succinylglutamate desuccinylase/aspartoacylase family protein [Flavobacteriales bacterium]
MKRSHRSQFDLKSFEKGKKHEFFFDMVSDGLGIPISMPVIVLKGRFDGPTLGITAVVHGNELNGLSVIQNLVKEIDCEELSGTIVAIPVVNVPSFHVHTRRFIDNEDLNRIFPGKPKGNRSAQYVYQFMEGVAKKFDYLIDLHTASNGRINSYYIRANLNSKIEKEMAMLQNAEIVLHVPPKDGTLRDAVSELGIHAITVEVGDPNRFQKGVVRSSMSGIFNVLTYLKMLEDDIELLDEPPVICSSSEWLYTDHGGVLEVKVKLCEKVEQGEVIATLKDVFGNLIKSYHAPNDGIVIGRSVQPIGQTGSRIIHLGKIKSKL